MNEKIICEVMLKSYKYLEAMCDQVEAKAIICALGSRNKDVFECAERLIQLNNEKITYCNIKVIIDEALNSISRNDELKAYYIDGEFYKDIAQREKITERTFFYRLKKQKKLLFEAIQEKYDTECLFELVRGSRWLFDRYHKAVRRAENEGKGKGKEMNDQKPKTAQVGK